MPDDELPDELEDEFDESDLHLAAQDGDMTRVRQLLADGRSRVVTGGAACDQVGATSARRIDFLHGSLPVLAFKVECQRCRI